MLLNLAHVVNFWFAYDSFKCFGWMNGCLVVKIDNGLILLYPNVFSVMYASLITCLECYGMKIMQEKSNFFIVMHSA